MNAAIKDWLIAIAMSAGMVMLQTCDYRTGGYEHVESVSDSQMAGRDRKPDERRSSVEKSVTRIYACSRPERPLQRRARGDNQNRLVRAA